MATNSRTRVLAGVALTFILAAGVVGGRWHWGDHGLEKAAPLPAVQDVSRASEDTPPRPAPNPGGPSPVPAPAEPAPSQPPDSGVGAPTGEFAGVATAELFRQGVWKVERNRGDSLGFSAEELEIGIAQLEEALKRGCADRKRALVSLTDAYHTLVFRTEATSMRKRAYLLREGELYQALQVMEPYNAEWSLAFVRSLPEPEERVAALRKMAVRFPESFDANHALAELLCERGDAAASAEHVRAAARLVPLSDAEEASAIGRSLVATAYRCGGDRLGLETTHLVEERLASK